jgi:hypothetical protein
MQQLAHHPPENMMQPVIGFRFRLFDFLRLASSSRRVSGVTGEATASTARNGWFRDSQSLQFSAFFGFQRPDPACVGLPVFPVPVGLSGLV